jgi:hypothetical protein
MGHMPVNDSKNSFILYKDQYDSMRSLAVAQKAQLLDAIYLYHLNEQIPELDPVVQMAFSFIKRQFDKDNDKYAEKCRKASKSARMRWDANACERIKRNAFDADNDTDTDSLNSSSLLVHEDEDSGTPECSAKPSGSAAPTNTNPADGPVYITKKKRKLTGKRLETFERAWRTFGDKRDKANAADAWLDIPELTNILVDKICAAAMVYATHVRPRILAANGTPKMFQGWLSARRWEDEVDTTGAAGVRPTTYAQAQDLERRMEAESLKREMGLNHGDRSDDQGGVTEITHRQAELPTAE